MSRIKDRISKMYKTLGLTAAIAVTPSAHGATENFSNDSETQRIETYAGILEDTNNQTMIKLSEINLDPDYVFSAEELESLETGEKGKNLANKALSASHTINDETHCFRAFKLAAKNSGMGTFEGVSAYMAAGQLAENCNFVEIKCDKKDFGKLPDGAVIVYGKGKLLATRNGHIGTIVNHKDVSSKVRNINKSNTKMDKETGKRVYYGDSEENKEPRVFLPEDTLVKPSLAMQMQAHQVEESPVKKTLDWEDAVKICWYQNSNQNISN